MRSSTDEGHAIVEFILIFPLIAALGLAGADLVCFYVDRISLQRRSADAAAFLAGAELASLPAAAATIRSRWPHAVQQTVDVDLQMRPVQQQAGSVTRRRPRRHAVLEITLTRRFSPRFPVFKKLAERAPLFIIGKSPALVEVPL